jgi:hypothetical protein
VILDRLRQRDDWKLFSVLPRADGRLAVAWWAIVILRGVLPVLFALAMGTLVSAIQGSTGFAAPLAVVGVVFVLGQVLPPINTAASLNLGDRTACWLYDQLTAACVRPFGMGHLEDPSLTADLTVARDFDLGMTGPPLSYSLDFIAGGLIGLVAGLVSAVILFRFVVGAARAWGAWLATHRLLREAPSGSVTATPRKFGARSGTPTTRSISPSIRPPARNCGCSVLRAG